MAQSDTIKIGERLATLRKLRGLSQRALGEQAGISWRSLQNWEAATREISASALAVLADRFGWNPYWILTGLGSPTLIGLGKSIEESVIRVHSKQEDMKIELPLKKIAQLIAMEAERRLNGSNMSEDELKSSILMGETND